VATWNKDETGAGGVVIAVDPPPPHAVNTKVYRISTMYFMRTPKIGDNPIVAL
jgi:hypothetical protein